MAAAFQRRGKRCTRIGVPAALLTTGALLNLLPFDVAAQQQQQSPPPPSPALACNASSHAILRVHEHQPTWGHLTSTNYPHPYPSNQRCSMELSAPLASGLIVHLTFVALDLSPQFSKSGQCLRDYVRIMVTDRDGREHVGRRICGSWKSGAMPKPLRGMQSRVQILFVSSFSATLHRGYKIRYDFVPEERIGAPPSIYNDEDERFRAECGGTHNEPTALSGEIRSPGYPFGYPRDVVCNWLIRVEPYKRIYVRLIHLELSSTVSECERASLSISDGYRYESGDTETMAALARRINSGAEDGPDVKYCGGQVYYNEEGMKSYLSTSNRVLVRFVSRDHPAADQLAEYKEKGTAIGFRLLWTKVVNSLMVDEPDDEDANSPASRADVDDVALEAPQRVAVNVITEAECHGFLCRGGEFCVDDGLNICAERTRLCINETLRCDGVANCAENDDSDEHHCYSQSTFTLVGVATFLFVLISTLLLLTYRSLLRCRSGKRRKRADSDHRNQSAKNAPAAPNSNGTANSNGRSGGRQPAGISKAGNRADDVDPSTTEAAERRTRTPQTSVKQKAASAAQTSKPDEMNRGKAPPPHVAKTPPTARDRPPISERRLRTHASTETDAEKLAPLKSLQSTVITVIGPSPSPPLHDASDQTNGVTAIVSENDDGGGAARRPPPYDDAVIIASGSRNRLRRAAERHPDRFESSSACVNEATTTVALPECSCYYERFDDTDALAVVEEAVDVKVQRCVADGDKHHSVVAIPSEFYRFKRTGEGGTSMAADGGASGGGGPKLTPQNILSEPSAIDGRGGGLATFRTLSVDISEDIDASGHVAGSRSSLVDSASNEGPIWQLAAPDLPPRPPPPPNAGALRTISVDATVAPRPSYMRVHSYEYTSGGELLVRLDPAWMDGAGGGGGGGTNRRSAENVENTEQQHQQRHHHDHHKQQQQQLKRGSNLSPNASITFIKRALV